ncbi:SIX homeobox [Cichlidogyrus casuarinus]|uniref:SIX homeobox n=1 Tax=Cichlidogyrus casuarinus TaxID=1844966 RepID=A0ABD2Q0G5_9PLAT
MFISLEDSFEDERKRLKDESDKLVLEKKQLDLQLRNANDHSNRLEERLTDSKKETSKLQLRLNELLESNAELSDRVKVLQAPETNAPSSNKLVIPKRGGPAGSTFNSSDLGGFDEMPADVGDFLTADEDDLPEPVDADLDPSRHSVGEFAGAHSEVQKLIREYMELTETKEALSIVKDDLITQVDSLNSENLQLHSTILELNDLKSIADERVSNAEMQLSQLRHELQNTKQELDSFKAEDQLPSGQRKRFTSTELRQVINERNRFKKELLELEEAVRLMEMARAGSRGALEFATLSGNELTNAVRLSAEHQSKPFAASSQNASSPGLSGLAKFISFGRSSRGGAESETASIASAESPRRQQRNIGPQSSWISLNAAKQYSPTYGWVHKHSVGKLPPALSYPIPVHCRQIEASGTDSPLTLRASKLHIGSKLEITVGIALTHGLKIILFLVPQTAEKDSDLTVEFQKAIFDKSEVSESQSPLGVIMGSNDGQFLVYRLPALNCSEKPGGPLMPPSMLGQFRLKERGQAANEISAFNSNILMAITSPSDQTRFVVLRWSPDHTKQLTWGPFSCHSLPKQGDGAGPIIMSRNFVTPRGEGGAILSLWMGTVGGGYLHCFDANRGEFTADGINLPESSVCMHSLDFCRQSDGDFLLAAVSGPSWSDCATSVARIVRISVDQRTVVQIFDLTEAITRAVDMSNVTDPVDLTISRLLMDSHDHWVWFITRSGLVGRLHYSEHVINSDTVLVQCPEESLYLSCHGFRRALIAAFMRFQNVSTFGAHVLAIGHDYVDLKPGSMTQEVVREQPKEFSCNSRRTPASTNAHVIIWRLQ